MDIVFVILHYMVEQETQKCVEYIRNNIDTSKYHIIIVDNASSNGSGKILCEKYKEGKDVTVLLNRDNLGFAKGNNVGFSYAKEKWNPEYIVLLNNDVYLLDKNLKQKLDDEYQNSGFAVLGPLIMTRDGRCDINPVRERLKTKEEILQEKKRYIKKRRRYKYNYATLYYKLAAAKGALVGPKKKKNKDYLERKENVQLHGCFLVFSKKYMDVFEGLDDRTFLYFEEDILYKHTMANGLKTIYSPHIVVYHQEDAATDAVIKKEKAKVLFLMNHYIESINVLLQVYDMYDK